MNILKNRTVLGAICIVLSLIICFALTPLWNAGLTKTVDVVRVVKEIGTGEQITADMVQTVTVGGYNLPDAALKNMDNVVGRYATADLYPGDYVLGGKLSDTPTSENIYLYSLNGEKQAISVTVKAFANGLSGKLRSGDIVTVLAADFRKQGLTVIPPELQYVEVIAVTASSGYDANTGETNGDSGKDGDDKKELPATVTLLVLPEQAKVLAELEADGKLHIALAYRGAPENAAKFIEAQEAIIAELYPPEDDEDAEGEDAPAQDAPDAETSVNSTEATGSEGE